MSEKMNCPGCKSYTFSVLDAYERGQACPHCGLSANATREILAVRKSVANKDLQDRCAAAITERDIALQRLRHAERRLDRVRVQLDNLAGSLNEPLQNEKWFRS